MRKGFTLIELLVVISIIGLLAAAGLAVFTNASRRARGAKVLQDLQAIEKAMNMWVVNEYGGEWPTEGELTAQYGGGFGNVNIQSIIDRTSLSEYMTTAPTTPAGGAYHYDNDGDINYTCSSSTFYYSGVNILIRGSDLQNYYSYLNEVADQGAVTLNGSQDVCQKVKTNNITASAELSYLLADHQ